MAYCGYNWIPQFSHTAIKYQKYGFVENKPFLPGERLRSRKEMEKGSKVYKDLRLEVDGLRRKIKEQKKTNSTEKTIQTSFYKSPVKTRYTLVLSSFCVFIF